MFYTYVLFSDSLQKKYVGSTGNLQKRLEHHNLGLDRWSSRGIPWKLVYFEEFATKTAALRRELFFKSGQGRAFVDEQIAKSVPPEADLKNTKFRPVLLGGFDS